MPRTALLTSFTPSVMDPAVLESLLVGRERLAGRILQIVRDAVSGHGRRHMLLIGPHGSGKTHLISLIHHRVLADGAMRGCLAAAWLREDEWGVTSFLDVLLRTLRALPAEQPDAALAERVEELYRMPAAAAEKAAGSLLAEVAGERTLLVMVENLDEVFKGLGPEGQKRFRAYLDEHPSMLLLATAQCTFEGVTRRDAPFHGVFVIQPMDELTPENAARLVGKIAALKMDYRLDSFLQTPAGRARIRAAHHLAGGNHRVWIIFSQFLTRESLDGLHEPLTRALDDLTPYYHARMAWISPQQRKLVEFLCERKGAVPVREIAQHCFMTHQTASSQLKILREMRYVRAESVGRDSYYELREPLMRLCLEVKQHRGEPVRLLVEFLRLWFADLDAPLCDLVGELDWRYRHAPAPHARREPRTEACFQELEMRMPAGDFERALLAANELVSIRGKAQDWYVRGYCLARLGHELPALASFTRAASLDPHSAQAWAAKGRLLWLLGRYEKALASFRRAAELEPGDAAAACDQGIVLCQLGRQHEALELSEHLSARHAGDPRPWIVKALALGGLENHYEALGACDRALSLGARHPALSWIRAESLAALRRWREMEEALADALGAGPISAETALIPTRRLVRQIFAGAREAPEWNSCLPGVIALYRDRGIPAALALALDKNIPAVLAPAVSILQAQEWHRIWRGHAGSLQDFRIPLQLLESAVRYSSSRDPRILLALQMEYRTLLAPLVALHDDQARAGAAAPEPASTGLQPGRR